MLDKLAAIGAHDACARFGVDLRKIAEGAPPGLMSRAMSFGSGQLDAAKQLFHNMRGGLGGAHAPGFGEAIAGGAGPLAPGPWHRQQAVGNLKTMWPTLAVGGGMLALHRHSQAVDAQRQQQQQAMQQQQMQPPYGAPY